MRTGIVKINGVDIRAYELKSFGKPSANFQDMQITLYSSREYPNRRSDRNDGDGAISGVY
jgi:hypothetical protein